MKKFGAWSSVIFLLCSYHTFARERLNQKAHYILSKSRSRTSALISKGHINVHLSDFDDATRLYTNKYDYALWIMFSDARKGEGQTTVNEVYFTDEFRQRIRDEKKMEFEHLKVEHQGITNVTLSNGKKLQNCDKLYVYDLSKEELYEFIKETKEVLFV